ncbi:MAG: hypothetical protein U1E26_04435 [Coriobacteriia bacterium]|nr:hypothetical protein [Coriobacteriia bacterium]
MRKRVCTAGAVLALASILIVAVPMAASAARSNAECAVCHGAGSIMDNAVFDVGAVDKDTACRKCHLDSLVNTHPNHYAGGNCSSVCHRGWGSSLAARVPSVLTPAGAFASWESPNMSSDALHQIHATPRWASDIRYEFSKCGSCHATAACTACHNGTPVIDNSHGVHGTEPTTTPITPWVGDVSPGVISGQADDTLVTDSEVRCGAGGCHDIEGRSQSAPLQIDCYDHPAYPDKNYVSSIGALTKVGSWSYLSQTTLSLMREIHSNSTAASVTIRFTGQRVTVVGTADSYRGIGEVLINGVSQGTFDQFRAITKRQVPVWTSATLPLGEHTITIRPTGTKNPLSRGTWISFDHIAFDPVVGGTAVPQCVSCHAAQGEDSHYGSGGPGFSHEVSQTISATNLWNTGYGSYSCDKCHVAPLITEHRRPTSSGVTASSSCVICHTDYAGTSWTGTYPLASSCDFGECHSLASGRQRHLYTVSKHEIAPVGESRACTGCHGVDMRAAHANSVPGNGFVETNGCLACHSTTSHASATACTASGCHPSTFNAMADHSIASASSHVASEAGKPFTRAYQTVAGLDDGGRECAECHSSHLFFAHSDAPAVSCATGGAGGVGCHLDTRLGSVGTASSGWASRKCADCHEYGPARTHDSTATAHLSAPNGCAGSGTYCHSSSDLWQIHLRAQNGGPAEGESCANIGCHDTLDSRPSVNPANPCGSTSTGCHTSYTMTHATNFQHAFSTASYYSTATNSGCTNRTGCHNAGVGSTADFGVVHHPDAGCFQSACHQSASKPGFSGLLPTDCQECHTASAFAGAPARANLAASPAAGGHYSETTHTAGGMTAAVTAGGTASATCSQCHSATIGGTGNGLANQHTNLTIAGSPYGSALACGECHADTRTFGYAQVDTDWPARTCAACHLPGGSSPLDHATTAPAVAEVTTTCGSTGINCHNSTDLHVLHNDAAGCDLTGCHVYTLQAAKPTAKSCGTGGACHTAYTKNSHLHNGDAAKHQPTALTQANVTTFYGTPCGSCHDIRNSNSSLTLEHSLSTSAKSTNGTNVCLNCHNNAASTTAVGNSWSAKDSTSACSACHTGSLAIHADANSAAHTTANAGCASTGIGCHNSADLSSVGTTATAANTVIHNSCLRCHSRTGSASWSSAMIGTATNLRYNPTVKTCGGATGCHTSASYSTASGFHRIGRGDVVNGNDAKHTDTVMTGTITSGVASATCASCHSGQLNTAHATALTGWANTCTGCHNSTISGSVAANQVKANWTNDDCGDCHTAGASAVKIPNMHSKYGTASHSGTSPLGCGASGTNCHTTYDLAVLHGKTLTNGCQVAGCHDAVNKVMTSAPKSCGVGGTCHSTYTMDTHTHLIGGGDAAKHQPTTLTQANTTQFGVACGSCHDIRNSGSSLTLEHTLATSAKSTNGTNVCLNCHNNAASTTAVGNSWSAKDTTSACAACHTGGLAIHANENVAAHSTQANTGCASTGVGCHNGVDLSRVGPTNVVNTNIHTSCLRCHDRTGSATWTSAMIGTATNLRYNPTEKRCGQASGCHTSDLYSPVSGFHRIGRGDVVNGNDAKHTGTSMTTTVGSGANNTCAACHSPGLANAHPTTMTGWANICTSCHNSTLATNVSPAQVKAGWTNNLCTDCHTTGASASKIPNMHSKYGTASHNGVPAAGNTCDPACHPSYTTLDLGDIHDARPAGCAITGCHAIDKQMPTAVTARSCGGTNSCHNGYLDGNHGFNAASHTTTDENSWKNCGRCHLGYRADYTRTGTFNGNLSIDAETPSGPDRAHRNAANGGTGCSTCHDPASRVYDPKGVKTANCSQCHVDHYSHDVNVTPYTTTSTSNTNLAKTITLDFTGMATADVFFDLATTDNAVTANARLEIGPVGTPFYTQTVNTTSMDPNRKKFSFRGINAAGRTGNQQIRLYVWKGAGTATIINDVFDASVSRSTHEAIHTADVSGFSCSFGDCHSANIIAEHDKYEIPGAWTGGYVWPANPTRENLSAVQAVSTAPRKVKSLTLDLDEIDKIGVRLNLYHGDRWSRTISFEVRIGANVLASGSYFGNQTQRWWDYRQGGTNPSGGALDYIDTTGYSGFQAIELWIATDSATTRGAAQNSTFQVWSGEREYLPSTPTDPCDVCHLNTGRIDNHGAPQPGDLNLTPSTPKLTGIGPQCDTCHPDWAVGHPEFGHRASKASDTCILGCHQYKPAIDGAALADPYDLTQKHDWGDNTGAGMTYTPGTVLGTENFGTTTTWPGTWTRSDATYVTNQTGSARSGAAPQIGVNTTRTEYNFYRNAAFNTQNYSGGGLLRFWYQVNVGTIEDFLVAEYSTVSAAGPYTELWRRDTDALTWTQTPWLHVPRSSNVWIRFRGTFNTAGEYGRVDDLEMTGSNRSFSGTMEGGCATGSTGACHNQGYPARGECQDCHTAVNHHDTIHDLSVGGTRTQALATGFSFDSCVGTCHTKNLHWNHGVGLAETDPRPYRAPGMGSDGIMTCATCHASANATIRNLSNDASTPIASGTLMCAQCHTGSAGMASLGHAGVSTSWRPVQPLKGANLATEFSNATSVSGHRVAPFTTAMPSTNQYRWDTNRWYIGGTIGTVFTFDNFTAAPGQTNAKALLRATVVGPDGTAGTAVPLKAGGTALSTTMSVHCSDCHGESTGNMQGPQGAATSIAMLDDFTFPWVTQPNNLIVENTLICNRCHDINLGTNTRSAHRSNNGHVGSGRPHRCIACHVAIPHAWKRPKLLVNYNRDAGTPYVINPGTATGSSLRGWSPESPGLASTTFDNSANCASTGCRSHSGADTVP